MILTSSKLHAQQQLHTSVVSEYYTDTAISTAHTPTRGRTRRDPERVLNLYRKQTSFCELKFIVLKSAYTNVDGYLQKGYHTFASSESECIHLPHFTRLATWNRDGELYSRCFQTNQIINSIF